MSNERLDDWKKQETAFNYARDRKLGPGLCRAALQRYTSLRCRTRITSTTSSPS